jgi:predicted  nucleic acid-binding Zn-ribbon protein
VTDSTKLYELQKLDTLWEKVRRRLTQLRTLLVESDELKAARQELATFEQEQQRWQAQQRTAELEAQSLAERITATEQQLMSGQVRNPKELAALQANVEALRRQRDAVEGQGVEALLKVEEGSNQVEQQRKRVQTIERKWTASQTELLNEEAKLKKAFMQCKKQRETLAAALGPVLLKRYEDLRQRKAGIAVAAIEREMCSACHVKVPTGVISAARSQGNDFVYCTSCARILVMV